MDKKTWIDFREAGFLWLINSILQLFGWSIVIDIEKGKITDVYPARVPFRGFDEKANDEGYFKVTRYMRDNAGQLLKECGNSLIIDDLNERYNSGETE